MGATINPIDPDLESFARAFASRAAAAPDEALQQWRADTAGLTEVQRDIGGRLAAAQLDWQAKAVLGTRRDGTALITEWDADRLRAPYVPRLPLLSQRQTYAYCAGIVLQRGTAAAVNALQQGRMILVGLRRETSTLANQGLGVYDDHIVVLNGGDGLRTARVFPACTEPGAQYAHRASPVGNGRLDDRYKNVRFKHTEGFDVNGDGIAEIGRLRAGTYFFGEKPRGHVKRRAFEATRTQTAERDTNGDGRFNAFDPNRIDTKNAQTTMYIHRGGTQASGNTWSAGCQTIPDDLYYRFLASLGQMSSFHYVLVDGY
ncbi:hypothetical protein [Roseateles amylovorans]|uniref:YkuD domain-containing protein n=1 Tax=Roseateles amylovorans TaxID=2978473 RepID=A0ABY6B4Q5_9BURK|nr:hypothetical protein [Roseateles amylovorans]UXH78245.1 hypothetical protein N4261_25400 [Roseateles amylovorans]